MTQLWGALEGKPEQPTESEVVALYDAVNGGQDNGAYCLDVLKAWRARALAGDAPFAFAQVDQSRRLHVEASVAIFSSLYIGLALPQTAQDEVGKIWRTHYGPPARAGSWGGHCVPVVAYDGYGLTCVTWGALQRMSWTFFRRYCDEAYAVLPRSWEGLQPGHAPTGIDVSKLQADLQAISNGLTGG